MSNAEEGIARAQIAADQKQNKTLADRQKWSIAYVNERILVYVYCFLLLGLIVVWATAKSPYVVYGSLGTAILLTVVWGVWRIRQIDRSRELRAQQVREMQSRSADDGGD